ncbi:MAG: hypothetical protein ACW990_01085 [Promethearchaeota archaeon]|jgi:hypothetical protein
MAAGKILVLIGALLTLVSTFFFAFFHVVGDVYGSGIGFIFNIPEIMADADLIATFIGTEVMVIYIVTIVFIVFLLSGILQLVGLINRVVALIGSIIALGIGILFMLIMWDLLPDMNLYTILLVDNAIVDGIWPLHVPVGTFALGTVSLGTYTLVAGGGLGLVGGIIGVKD